MSEGIAIAMGTITKYTQGARFLCTEETCQFSKGNKKKRLVLFQKLYNNFGNLRAKPQHDKSIFLCSLTMHIFFVMSTV